jgi:hypothetical protein
MNPEKIILSAKQQHILDVGVAAVKVGKNLVVDGVAGSGKTTLIANIRLAIEKLGIPCLTLTFGKSGRRRFIKAYHDSKGVEGTSLDSLPHTFTVDGLATSIALNGEFRHVQEKGFNPFDDKKRAALVDLVVNEVNQRLVDTEAQLLSTSVGSLLSYRKLLAKFKYSLVFDKEPFSAYMDEELLLDSYEEDELAAAIEAELQSIGINKWEWMLFKVEKEMRRSFNVLFDGDALSVVMEGNEVGREWLLSEFSGIAPVVLVDEFQDMTPLHVKFLSQLRQYSAGFIVVGDRCQYLSDWVVGKYSVENPFDLFKKTFRKYSSEGLMTSRRFGKNIADLATTQRAKCRFYGDANDNAVRPDLSKTDEVSVVKSDQDLLASIPGLLKTGKVCILVPTVAHSYAFSRAMTMASIPYLTIGCPRWGKNVESLLARGLSLVFDAVNRIPYEPSWLDSHALIALADCHPVFHLDLDIRASLIDEDGLACTELIPVLVERIAAPISSQTGKINDKKLWLEYAAKSFNFEKYISLIARSSDSRADAKISVEHFVQQLNELGNSSSHDYRKVLSDKVLAAGLLWKANKNRSCIIADTFSAKGQEFDVVIMPSVWAEEWISPEQRYVAITRAQKVIKIGKANA